jgi:hypothetical protein
MASYKSLQMQQTNQQLLMQQNFKAWVMTEPMQQHAQKLC